MSIITDILAQQSMSETNRQLIKRGRLKPDIKDNMFLDLSSNLSVLSWVNTHFFFFYQIIAYIITTLKTVLQGSKLISEPQIHHFFILKILFQRGGGKLGRFLAPF